MNVKGISFNLNRWFEMLRSTSKLGRLGVARPRGGDWCTRGEIGDLPAPRNVKAQSDCSRAVLDNSISPTVTSPTMNAGHGPL